MLREQRGSQRERDTQSAGICRHILDSDVYKRSNVIAGYAAMVHEADITAVLETALDQGKTVVMPICGTSPQMTLHRIGSLDELQTGRFGILAPPADAPVVDMQDIDLILVPLEGIDKNGYRLGKGGGYYDCLLGQCNAYAVGCALTWQIVENVPRDIWDKPLTALADVDGVRKFKRDCERMLDDGYQEEG